MIEAFIKNPIRVLQNLTGDEKGIREIIILDNELESETIPKELKVAAEQIHEYFEGKRTEFTF